MRYRIPCSSLVLLLAAALPAQDPLAMLAGGTHAASPQVCRDGDDVCGVGPDYLLRAEQDRVTFTPMLGADAPRSLPLTLRLLDVARGGETLSLEAPVRSERGAEICYRRGVVRERYQLRVDGVEQTFVFDERPAGEGDLVVRLGVECAVAGVPADDGGLRFVDAAGRGVVYGALCGVDARGATVPGSLQLIGDELQLRLPAAFVDDASYPLTFDPLLGTASLAGGTGDDAEPAVAWVGNPASWLVVWRRVVALGESHLIGQFVDPTTGAGAPFVISATAGLDVSMARAAGNQGAASFLVAWRSATGVFAQNPILRLRAVPASGAAAGAVQQFITDPRSLALADSSTGSSVLPVVWGDAGGVLHCQGLQFNGPASISSVSGATLDTVVNGGEVTISRHGGAQGRYVVAWTGGTFAPNGIVARVIDASGFLLGQSTAITGPIQPRNVSLDGDGVDFLLAWNDPTGEHVRPGQIVVSGVQFVPTLLGANVDLATTGTLRNGDVARVGNRYVVTYRRDASLFDTSCRVQVTDNVGTPIGPFVELAGPPRAGDYGRQGSARLAAIDSTNGVDDRLLTVFEEGQTTLPLDRDVVLQQFETTGPGGPVTTLAQACGVGGTCQAFGACVLGNSAFELRLTSGDPTAAFALLSLAVNPVLVPCGPCTLLAPDVLETLPISGGFASRPFPIPLNNSLIGASIAAEWLPAFGVPGPCPLFPFVTTSTVIRVEIGF